MINHDLYRRYVIEPANQYAEKYLASLDVCDDFKYAFEAGRSTFRERKNVKRKVRIMTNEYKGLLNDTMDLLKLVSINQHCTVSRDLATELKERLRAFIEDVPDLEEGLWYLGRFYSIHRHDVHAFSTAAQMLADAVEVNDE